MTEFLFLGAALATGLLLGAVFFGGLWWTVVRGISSPQPALWFLGSMLLRTSVILAGFYFAGRDDWRRWLLCLLGFVLARLIVKWLTHLPVDHHNVRVPESTYAP